MLKLLNFLYHLAIVSAVALMWYKLGRYLERCKWEEKEANLFEKGGNDK